MKTDRRHAYLIMVHKNTYVLEKLLQLLDCDNNDIYIHLDAKCQNFNWNKYCSLVHHSSIIKTKRVSVTWGDYSQIEAELTLLQEAYQHGKYQYYHLLSGQDMPLKTQEEIHTFFDQHNGSVFLSSANVSRPAHIKFDFSYSPYGRVSVKRIFLKRETMREFPKKILGLLDRCFAFFQAKFLKRDWVVSKNIQLAYGANWFSLPESAVKCVLDKQDKIAYYFKKAINADELFVQSILKECGIQVTNDNLRLVDWERGKNAHPYTWKISDYEQLIESEKLFARKFDENVDRNIVDKFFEYVSKR